MTIFFVEKNPLRRCLLGRKRIQGTQMNNYKQPKPLSVSIGSTSMLRFLPMTLFTLSFGLFIQNQLSANEPTYFSRLLVAQQNIQPTPHADSAQRQEPQVVDSQQLADLRAAIQTWESDQTNPENLIWVGRRIAYLGRYQEAIEKFSLGIEQFPQDARFLRHRGHRWITLREFDKAIEDLETATRLIEGTSDEVEPDGQPNAAGIPTSTLHTNVWYHLGLARFLKGDFEQALTAYERCLAAAKNDDMRVATLDWQYMTLRRLNRADEAQQLIAQITPELKILENTAYHRRILMYRGLFQPSDLMPEEGSLGNPNTSQQVSDSQAAINLATNGFGVGHWHLINGDKKRAREIFEEVVKGSSRSAFGFIAAEVELKRLQDVEAKPPRIYAGFKGYSRTVTCNSPEAQQWFEQGIQLLYGFNHDEAIRSFQKAADIDPGCAMAWWGSAYARGLHINNPEMTEEQSRLAREDADKALAALDDESPVERTLVEALDARYEWPAPEDRTALDQAYAGAMERAWHQFSDDPDVSALYAESLMNLQPWDLWTGEGKPKGRALEIAALLEKTLLNHPNHPGANHFYIHAIEASPWPELGIPAAERLLNLVPGSGHLVHMPSHIFIRVGRYAEAADANERAIAADEAYFVNAPPPNFYNVYFLHNLHFVAYTAMMEGRFEAAIAAARKIEQRIPEAFLREYVTIADGFMPTTLHVLIRFGKWEAILLEQEPPEWRLLSRAQHHYARCIALTNLGRVDAAENELNLFNQVSNQMDETWKVGNNKAIDVIAVSRCMAEGEMAFHAGEHDRAYERLRAGVRLEDQLAYDEPPGWMQPVRHALGALLLAGNQLVEAELVYRTDLKRHPNNAWSLLGLQQALQKQGKQTEVDAMTESVKTAWARADVTPKASCYCHPEANR